MTPTSHAAAGQPAAAQPGSRTAAPATAAPERSELGTSLRTSISQVTRRMRALRADGDLGFAAVAVLGVLVKEGPLSLTALSERERVTPASASQSVNRLAADDLVRRSPDPDDGRRVLLSVTPAGRAVYEQARGPATAWLESELAALSDRDRRTLERAAAILERMARVERTARA